MSKSPLAANVKNTEDFNVTFINNLPTVDRKGYDYWGALVSVAPTAARKFASCMYYICEETGSQYLLKDMMPLNKEYYGEGDPFELCIENFKVVHKSVIRKVKRGYEKYIRRYRFSITNVYQSWMTAALNGIKRAASWGDAPKEEHVRMARLPYPPLNRKQMKQAKQHLKFEDLQSKYPNRPNYLASEYKEILNSEYLALLDKGLTVEQVEDKVMKRYWKEFEHEMALDNIVLFNAHLKWESNQISEQSLALVQSVEQMFSGTQNQAA